MIHIYPMDSQRASGSNWGLVGWGFSWANLTDGSGQQMRELGPGQGASSAVSLRASLSAISKEHRYNFQNSPHMNHRKLNHCESRMNHCKWWKHKIVESISGKYMKESVMEKGYFIKWSGNGHCSFFKELAKKFETIYIYIYLYIYIYIYISGKVFKLYLTWN